MYFCVSLANKSIVLLKFITTFNVGVYFGPRIVNRACKILFMHISTWYNTSDMIPAPKSAIHVNRTIYLEYVTCPFKAHFS